MEKRIIGFENIENIEKAWGSECPNCGNHVLHGKITEKGILSLEVVIIYHCNKCGCIWEEDY